MKAWAVIILGSLLLAATPGLCQHPNLSGLWERGESGNSVVYSVDHQDAVLKFSFKSSFQAGSLAGGLSGSGTYGIDGVERHTSAGNGRESWITVNWEGPTLIILRVMKDGYRVSVTREAWSLSEEGRTLTRTKRDITMDGVRESAETFHRRVVQ